MKYILIAGDGNEYGPYSISELQCLYEESRLELNSRLRGDDGKIVVAGKVISGVAKPLDIEPDSTTAGCTHNVIQQETIQSSSMQEEDFRGLLRCRTQLGWILGFWFCGWALVLQATVNRSMSNTSSDTALDWTGRASILVSALLYEQCIKRLPYSARISGIGKPPSKSLGILYMVIGPFSPILIYDLYKRLNQFMAALNLPGVSSPKVVELLEQRISQVNSLPRQT